MKSIFQTINGMEAYSGIQGESLGFGVILSLQEPQPIRTALAWYSYLTHFTFTSQADLLSKLRKKNIRLEGSFSVRCTHYGENKIGKTIEGEIGAVLENEKNRVNLKNPDSSIHAFLINTTFVLGKLAGEKKEDYLVKRDNSSLTPPFAAALLNLAAYNPKKHLLLNPLCKDGVIAIEAFLLGGKNIKAFDNEHAIRNSRINAKIARVSVNAFTIMNLDWSTTKFEQHSADRIISALPSISKRKKESRIKLVYDEFCTSCFYLLKEDGLGCTVTHKKEPLLSLLQRKFDITLVKEITRGKQPYVIIAFKRS